MAKKLEGSEALLFKNLLSKNKETVVDIDGVKYLIKPLEVNDIQKEIESNPKLKKMILRSDKDISEGKVFTTEEILEQIQQGEL